MMHILINREDMLFIRKMDSHILLSKLAHIELPHKHVLIMNCDNPSDFRGLTDLELKLLIKHSGGPDVANVFARLPLMEIAFKMTESMPLFVGNAFEIDMQMRAIPEGDDGRYEYVPGSYKPRPADGLAEHAALKYAGSPLTAPASSPQHVPQGPVAGSVPRAPTPQPADDFAQPKPGTSTHTIFQYCAQQWKATECVDDEQVLAHIRKQAVDHLVPTGLNVSTVRTQAMRWYHNRKRFAM